VQDVRSSFLKPSRTLGGLAELADWAISFSAVGFSFASPAAVSMVHRRRLEARPTADEGGGKGAAGDGAGGHSPGRGDGRALQKHGESNWREWRG
jgi:hypothetical protein